MQQVVAVLLVASINGILAGPVTNRPSLEVRIREQVWRESKVHCPARSCFEDYECVDNRLNDRNCLPAPFMCGEPGEKYCACTNDDSCLPGNFICYMPLGFTKGFCIDNPKISMCHNATEASTLLHCPVPYSGSITEEKIARRRDWLKKSGDESGWFGGWPAPKTEEVPIFG